MATTQPHDLTTTHRSVKDDGSAAYARHWFGMYSAMIAYFVIGVWVGQSRLGWWGLWCAWFAFLLTICWGIAWFRRTWTIRRRP